jgi:hypothetical protein
LPEPTDYEYYIVSNLLSSPNNQVIIKIPVELTKEVQITINNSNNKIIINDENDNNNYLIYNQLKYPFYLLKKYEEEENKFIPLEDWGTIDNKNYQDYIFAKECNLHLDNCIIPINNSNQDEYYYTIVKTKYFGIYNLFVKLPAGTTSLNCNYSDTFNITIDDNIIYYSSALEEYLPMYNIDIDAFSAGEITEIDTTEFCQNIGLFEQKISLLN